MLNKKDVLFKADSKKKKYFTADFNYLINMLSFLFVGILHVN